MLKMNASSMYGVPLSIGEAWAHIAVEENQNNVWAKSRGIASRTIPNEHTVWGDVQTLIRKKKGGDSSVDYLGHSVKMPEGS